MTILSIFTTTKVYAADVIGKVTLPAELNRYGNITVGFGPFLSNILRVIFVCAGIYSLFNFIIGGFGYIMAAGDAKKLQSSWDRIWYSLLGLVIMVGSFALSAILGQLLFGNAGFFFNPTIYKP